MNDVKPPLPETLRKYGLSLDDWREILERQGNVCAICELEPKSGRMVVDHEHVRGYKKLPPEERKRRIRGILCWFCNHWYVGRSITVKKARNVVAYLEEYEARKPAAVPAKVAA